MEKKKRSQHCPEKRKAIVKELQEKMSIFMEKRALSNKEFYEAVGIVYNTFRSIVRYGEEGIMLPRLEVLYKVRNYLDVKNSG